MIAWFDTHLGAGIKPADDEGCKSPPCKTLTTQPSGKKWILESPAHGVLQFFATQNLTIFQKLERFTHGIGRHVVPPRRRLRGQRHAVSLHRRRKYSLLNRRQPIPDCRYRDCRNVTKSPL